MNLYLHKKSNYPKTYPTLLAKSKIVFSANLQETLGIGAYEGSPVGALSLVPID